MCNCPPCPLSPPVLAELQQADLITSEECEGMYDSSDVVRVQSGKSPEVQSKTADVLRRHGFEKESMLLSGKQTQPLIHVYGVLYSGVWLLQIGLVQKKALDLVIIERLTPLTEALQGCQVLLAVSHEYGSKLSAPPLGRRCLHSLNGSHCFTVFQTCEGIIVNALFAKFE